MVESHKPTKIFKWNLISCYTKDPYIAMMQFKSCLWITKIAKKNSLQTWVAILLQLLQFSWNGRHDVYRLFFWCPYKSKFLAGTPLPTTWRETHPTPFMWLPLTEFTDFSETVFSIDNDWVSLVNVIIQELSSVCWSFAICALFLRMSGIWLPDFSLGVNPFRIFVPDQFELSKLSSSCE